MAVEFNLDEEKKKQEQLNAPQLSSPSGGTEGLGRTVDLDQNESPKGSGRAPNVRKFIEANQGQGDQMVGRIEKSGEDRASRVRDAIQGRKQEFSTQADNIRNVAQTGAQAAQNIAQNATQYVPQNNQELDSQKQEEIGQFQKAYTGLPDELSNVNRDLSDVNRQNQDLGQFAERAQSESGRFQLLRDVLGRSPGENYSRGQQRLDQLLLQGSAGSGKRLNQSLSGFAQEVGEEATGLGKHVQDEYGNLQTLADDTSGNIRNLFDTNIKSVEDQVSQRAGNRQQMIDQYSQVADRLGNESASQEDLDFLSSKGYDFLTPETNLYDVDLAKYLNPEAMTTQLQAMQDNQFANADEIAKYKALQQLSGLQGNNMNFEEFQDPFKIDSENLQKDLAQRGQDYTTATEATKKAMEAMAANSDLMNWMTRWRGDDPTTTASGNEAAQFFALQNGWNPEAAKRLMTVFNNRMRHGNYGGADSTQEQLHHQQLGNLSSTLGGINNYQNLNNRFLNIL